MSAELTIEDRRSPNRESGRAGNRPQLVVLHTTDGSFDGTCAWFESADSRVSAHYLVGLEGRIARFVDESDTAHHAGRVLRAAVQIGSADPNLVSIGIEFEDGGDPFGVERPDVQYETGARLLTAVCARWGIPIDREHVVGHREVFAAKDCPGNLDVDRLVREASRHRTAPSLAVLVPVRNGADDLPDFMAGIEALDAQVIALDDGSSDRTGELLASHPRVATLLENPQRESYADWDDGANRTRLLAAAEQSSAEWILFLDVDERIDADDAAALRDFLATDALPGIAYGLQLFRTWGELVAARPTYVYRLFAAGSGTELREGRLHVNPVPAGIPRAAWVRTTIRLRHLDSDDRLEQRRRKYEQADPAEAHRRPSSDRELDPPRGRLERWRPRQPGLGVLAPPEPAAELPHVDVPEPPSVEPAATRRPTLVCLLPVRDGSRDLPGYLESVDRFCDAVIALDDGSTDGTAAILEAAPIVARVIRRDRRTGFEAWNDADNRQRLLDAAAELEPLWVMFLDVDERIPEDDADLLRTFVERDARPGHAYGFRVHRMLGDEQHYDRAELWVYRLFAYRPDQRLPDERLHLVPVPISIPGTQWQKTTVRIQHLAGLTEARRRQRLAKYELADPELRWQSDYERLILEVGEARPWRPRPPGLPVLADPAGTGAPLDLETLDPDAPLLSAIVISRNDERTIERSVRAVVEQQCDAPFEVIVVVSGRDRTAEVVRERFPDVTVIELGDTALPGRARNAGLAVARGEYVSFPGSHVELPPGSLATRLRAHERGWAMVTGSIVNGNHSRPGWASYFLDHSSALPGRPSGPLALAPAHCSYVRQFLIEAGGFPPDVRAAEDTVANHALWRRGHRAWREQELELVHRSPCSTVAKLLRHHFVRGRAFGRMLRSRERTARRAGLRRSRQLRGYARWRLRATDVRVAKWGDGLEDEYRRARRLVVAGILAAWVGTRFELALPRRLGSGATAEGDDPTRP